MQNVLSLLSVHDACQKPLVVLNTLTQKHKVLCNCTGTAVLKQDMPKKVHRLTCHLMSAKFPQQLL